MDDQATTCELAMRPGAVLPAPPAPDPARGPGLSILQAVGLLGLFLFCLFGAGVLGHLFRTATGKEPDPFVDAMLLQVIAWPVVIWSALGLIEMPARDLLPLRRFSPRLLPAMVLANFGAVVLLLAAATLIPMPAAMAASTAERYARSGPTAHFLSAVVLAPLAEELFFRGQLLHGFLRRYSVTRAVWASAALFAVFHLNPWQAVVALPLGVAYAWLTLRTGSLLPAILCHALANSTGWLLLPRLMPALGYSEADVDAMTTAPRVLLAMAAGAAALGGYLLWRQLERPRTAAPLP